MGDLDVGGGGGGCLDGDFTGDDSLGGNDGGFESSSSSFSAFSLFFVSFMGESLTPKAVLFGAETSFSFLSSTGDTDFTVFTLALDESESLLDVLRSFELLIGEELLGDFFTGLVSI